MHAEPLIQLNLQRHFGGGEVYTRFLTQALHAIGQPTLLLVQRDARFWQQLDLGNTPLIAVPDLPAAVDWLQQQPRWILTHGGVGADTAAKLAANHQLWGISHMPARGKNRFAHYHRVCAVSHYVLQTLHDAGVTQVDDEPLYGVADLARFTQAPSGAIRRNSRYDWDQRKLRDRLLGWLEPLGAPWRSQPLYQRRPGLTLGIVSRLTPIKQFPALFQHLAPIIAQHPDIHLEIFGAGGYASVRDLRQALHPLGARVRFWGQQRDVASVYRNVDYVLSGLPELEALGLNLLEAQACGTPVLAVRAAPFTETVADGVSGWLYTDPRQDQGADFARLLQRLHDGVGLPPPDQWQNHLARFSESAFQARVARLIGNPSIQNRPGVA